MEKVYKNISGFLFSSLLAYNSTKAFHTQPRLFIYARRSSAKKTASNGLRLFEHCLPSYVLRTTAWGELFTSFWWRLWLEMGCTRRKKVHFVKSRGEMFACSERKPRQIRIFASLAQGLERRFLYGSTHTQLRLTSCLTETLLFAPFTSLRTELKLHLLFSLGKHSTHTVTLSQSDKLQALLLI